MRVIKDNIEHSFDARLGFARAHEAIPDPERAGIKRIPTKPIDVKSDQAFEFHQCPVTDLADPAVPPPNLKSMGFDRVNLSNVEGVLDVMGQVRDASHLDEDSARIIRRALKGASLQLAGGGRMKILIIAKEGFVMRKAGPMGVSADPDEPVTERNGHRSAEVVHGDQDVYGTPLRQIMRGAAPWIFRHSTPDGRNRFSPIFLLNVWMPLQQVTQPLTLLDRRSLDAPAQQLRYGLPTDSFLDRDEETRTNNIWLFLHDATQRWYLDTEMSMGEAYVFDTLGEGHGAACLPGEDIARDLFLDVRGAIKASTGGDEETLCRVTRPRSLELPSSTPRPLRRAINAMSAVLNEAHRGEPSQLVSQGWVRSAERAADAVIRKSLEMRVVAFVS